MYILNTNLLLTIKEEKLIKILSNNKNHIKEFLYIFQHGYDSKFIKPDSLSHSFYTNIKENLAQTHTLTPQLEINMVFPD